MIIGKDGVSRALSANSMVLRRRIRRFKNRSSDMPNQMFTTPPPHKHTHYPSHTSPHPQSRYLSDGLDRSIWIELDSCSVTGNCNWHPYFEQRSPLILPFHLECSLSPFQSRRPSVRVCLAKILGIPQVHKPDYVPRLRLPQCVSESVHHAGTLFNGLSKFLNCSTKIINYPLPDPVQDTIIVDTGRTNAEVCTQKLLNDM